MKISNIVAEKNTQVKTPSSRVVISPNLKRVSERLDRDGNVINPVTKQIIREANT